MRFLQSATSKHQWTGHNQQDIMKIIGQSTISECQQTGRDQQDTFTLPGPLNVQSQQEAVMRERATPLFPTL